MITTLSYYDHQLFLWVQHNLHGSFLDLWFAICRDKFFWIPLYLFIISWIFIFHKPNFWVVIGFLILSITLSDQLSSNLLKKRIRRVRPCREIYFDKQFEPMIHCSNGFSMPSSHAVNHSSIGVYLFLVLGASTRRWRYILLFWPILIGFSQVFVGVHFPLDVCLGLVLGSIVGLLTYLLYKISASKIIKGNKLSI
jgi:membrane-associated phospholipid phosphatase